MTDKAKFLKPIQVTLSNVLTLLAKVQVPGDAVPEAAHVIKQVAQLNQSITDTMEASDAEKK